MLGTAMLMIVTLAAWTAFYLSFNPPSNEFEDILFLEGFLALGVACTMTCIELIRFSTTCGLLMSIGIASYALLYAITTPERCTQRRIEAHKPKAV